MLAAVLTSQFPRRFCPVAVLDYFEPAYRSSETKAGVQPALDVLCQLVFAMSSAPCLIEFQRHFECHFDFFHLIPTYTICVYH